MGKRHVITFARKHTPPFEATVIEGPNAAEVRAAIARSPMGLARWVLARDRIFLCTDDILHGELASVPKSLGHVHSTDGGLWWDEARSGFRLYVNDPVRESLITTERAFWRMVSPYPVFVVPPEFRHHYDASTVDWIPLRPDTFPERTERRDARRDEAAARAWEAYGANRLMAFLETPPPSPADNYAMNLRAKAAEMLAAGPPTIWHDGDRMRSARVDWRCDPDGSLAHVGGRAVAVTWSDRFTRHPLLREAIVDHFRIAKIAAAWDDGEELDPVDRILVEAEICGMMASDGIETVPPVAVSARQAEADAKGDSGAR